MKVIFLSQRKNDLFLQQRNLILRDSFGNISQIDVCFGLFRRYYVECKNYSSNVPLEGLKKQKMSLSKLCSDFFFLKDVAKFKEVLTLNRIPISRGIFVTTAGFTPRALTSKLYSLS